MDKVKEPPKRPKPNVDTLKGQVMFEWDERCQKWVTVYQPKTWWQRLLGLSPEPAYEPKGEYD